MKIKQLHDYENGNAVEISPVTIPDAVVDPTSQKNLTDILSGKVDAVSGKGLSTNDYTTTEKNKLAGIASGAEVNQNAFANVKVGSTTIAADAKSDTLTLTAGSNVTLTPDASGDSITIAATDTKYTAMTATEANTGTATTERSITAKVLGDYVKSQIDSKIAAADAMIYKGTIGTGGTVTALPATHSTGWTYKVITAGTYAGVACEVGDMIICLTDGTSANNSHWTVVQTNVDGAVTGPASATSGNVAVFNGTTGKVIKDSGFTIAKSVPANAVFTDTDTKVTSVGNHYTPAADSGSALSVDASSTTAATWNSTSLVTGVNLQRDAKGHVTGVTVDSVKMPANPNTDTNTTYTFSGGTNKFTVTPSGGSAQTVSVTPSITNNVTYNGTLTSGQVAVLDGTAGKIKASGYTIATSVPSGAVFTDTNTKVTSVSNHYTPSDTGSTTTSASGGTDTNVTGESGMLNVVTGVKKDAAGHIVGVTSANIYSKDTTYSSLSAASGNSSVSLVTRGEKYTWNNKASTAVATTSANGLMSAADKTTVTSIANPEVVDSASPFEYFLGATTVGGQTVFQKLSPSDVATVVAGLMPVATSSSPGLMPANKTNYNLDTVIGLDFNFCRDIGRFYGSFGGSNVPTEGKYYWSFFNLGYSSDWFVQIAHRAFSDGSSKMYRRMFYNGNTWTAWSEF